MVAMLPEDRSIRSELPTVQGEVRNGVDVGDETTPHHHLYRGVGCGEDGERSAGEVGESRAGNLDKTLVGGGWGPFARDLELGERKARFRALRMGVRLIAGPRGREAAAALLAAEISGADVDALAEALAAFNRLPPLDRRNILRSYQSLQEAT